MNATRHHRPDSRLLTTVPTPPERPHERVDPCRAGLPRRPAPRPPRHPRTRRRPQTRPVGFSYSADLDTVDIGGHNLAASQKYRNVRRDPRVSFVVDDLASVDPWRPRGVEIRGHAEIVTSGEGSTGDLIRIRPGRVLGWGLDTNAFAAPHARSVTPAT